MVLIFLLKSQAVYSQFTMRFAYWFSAVSLSFCFSSSMYTLCVKILFALPSSVCVLDSIESNLEQAVVHVEQANVQLQRAKDYQVYLSFNT